LDNPCKSPDCPAESDSNPVRNDASVQFEFRFGARRVAALADLMPLVFFLFFLLTAAFAFVAPLVLAAGFFAADFFAARGFLAVLLALAARFGFISFFDPLCLFFVVFLFFLVAIGAV
jgi:hypothetical protein